MRRWLQATLAARHGIAANLEFLTPGEFVARALAANPVPDAARPTTNSTPTACTGACTPRCSIRHCARDPALAQLRRLSRRRRSR